MGIRSATDFNQLCSGQFSGFSGRPSDIPSNPVSYFKEVSSFSELISIGEQASLREAEAVEVVEEGENVLSYVQLKELVREFNVTTIRQWKKAVKEGLLPGVFPSAPHSYYEEFEGWESFLAPKKSRFLDWGDALSLAKELRIKYDLKTAYDWRWLSRQGDRPRELPSAPDYYYSQFKTWKHFYGLPEE